MTKLGSQKIHICPKVTKMGYIIIIYPILVTFGQIGHRIDYNGVGALRGQQRIRSKINQSTPPRLHRDEALAFSLNSTCLIRTSISDVNRHVFMTNQKILIES